MRGVQAALSLSRSGRYGANSVLPEGPDPLMHPEAEGGYPPGLGGIAPGMGAPYMPRPPSMPRRAHFANDVEQPLSPANIKRQERLAPMAQSPLMRQASMAGNGQMPPWFAHAMGGQALRSPTMPAPHRRGPADWSRAFEPQSHNPEGESAAPEQRFTRQPTMPAPRRGPSDWSRDFAPQQQGHPDAASTNAEQRFTRQPTVPAPRRGPSDWSRDFAQSSHSGDVDGGEAAARMSVNQSLNVDALPTESFGLAQPAAAPPGAMASPPTSQPMQNFGLAQPAAAPPGAMASPPTSQPMQNFGLAQPAEAPPGAMASPPTSPQPPRGQLPSLDTAALSPRGLPPPAVPESPFASNPALFGTSTPKAFSSGEEAEKTFSSGEERDEIL
jgi:hypothetical protein